MLEPASWVLRPSSDRVRAWQAGAPVLLYHRIAPPGRMGAERPGRGAERDPFLLSEANLRRQVRWLLERFELVTVRDLVRRGKPERPGSRRAAITFDDGYACTYHSALPVLRELGVPATVFVETARLDSGGDALRGEDLGALLDAGFEIGSHSVSHPDLTALAPAQVEDELRASRERLEQLTGDPVVGFAYPFGRFDRRVERMVREAGYAYACSCHQDRSYVGATPPFAVPRIEVNRWDAQERFARKVAGHYSGVHAAWYRLATRLHAWRGHP